MRFLQVASGRALRDGSARLALDLQRFLQAALPDSLLITDATDLPSIERDDVVIVYSSAINQTIFAWLYPCAETIIVVNTPTPDPSHYVFFDATLAGELTVLPAFMAALREQGARFLLANPVLDISAETEVEPFAPTLHHFDNNVDGPTVLSLTTVEPSAQLQRQVQAMNIVCTYLHPRAHLAIVGPIVDDHYRECIEREINELNLLRVWIAGSVADAEKAAYLQRASALLATNSSYESLHSILLAMRFGIPVIGLTSPLLAQMCGDAAVLLPEDSGIELLAETITEVLSNESLRDALVRAGKTRAERYDIDVERATLLNQILELVQ